MTIDELKQKTAGPFADLVSEITGAKAKAIEQINTYLKQWETSGHDVLDAQKRPDKVYTTEKNETATAPVTRLGVPLQKQITRRAATFLCGNPIILTASPADEKQKKVLAAVEKVWFDNKLNYKSKQLAKLMMAETEAAELWYTEEEGPDEKYWSGILADSSKFKLRVRILANSLGDSLYPVFSPTGDMIAFGRGYTVNKEEFFDLYTSDTTYRGKKDSSGWTMTPVKHPFGKIPVVYYSQPQVEWSDVQTLIDRFEKQLSNHGDTNDYFGSPLMVVYGKVTGFAKKGDTGKMVQVDGEKGKLEVVTWDRSPESVKLELENLEKLIYACTDTPNISFEQMKSLGEYSGIALKMLFMGAHMKASDKEEIFGEGIQRRINYIKAVICGLIDVSLKDVKLNIEPKFEYFLPKNDLEKVDILSNARNSKIISRETAVRLNPVVENAETELQLLKDEASEDLDDEMNN